MKRFVLLLSFVFLACSTKPVEPEGVNSSTTEEVRATIRNNLGLFKDCYVKYKDLGKNSNGKVKVGFIVTDLGKVKTASIESSELKNPKLEGCMLDVLKQLQFPKATAGNELEIVFPFSFDSVEK